MKRAIIFAALGADSIPTSLQKDLSEIFLVTYVKNETPILPTAFIALAMDFHFIALTRRAIVQLDESILSQLPNLEGISAYSTGKEWIDEVALAERGIQLKTLPSYCTNAVAETALGLVLMQQHKLHLRYLKAIKKIPESVSLRGTELADKNVGIIGYGRIGSCLSLKIKYLCKNIFINDIDIEKYQNLSERVLSLSKKEIIEKCDIVIICASQQFEEKQILEQEYYDLFKRESVIINVARKSLLNHNLLLQMVKKKQIEAYIYDDLVKENDFPDEIEYGKIIPTGHTAWYTNKSIERGTNTWINNLLTFAKA
jgi:lactate dehydrogenase-like 2-hydroxyacid dehydrogenase